MSELRKLIREAIIKEVDIEDVTDACFVAGSTHVMQTCKINGDNYFLKFSRDSVFNKVDASLQILIEYLAYRIYGLYSGVRIPKAELVYDKEKQIVGIATSAVKGKQALTARIEPNLLGKMMSQGVYVDIFLANWDVVGTGTGNVFVSGDEAVRIDPAGMTRRAQGGKKGANFGAKVGELKSMLKRGTSAGNVYQHADLKVAAETFLRVQWSTIEGEINAVEKEVSTKLIEKGLKDVQAEWSAEVDVIRSTLERRYEEVKKHSELQ